MPDHLARFFTTDVDEFNFDITQEDDDKGDGDEKPLELTLATENTIQDAPDAVMDALGAHLRRTAREARTALLTALASAPRERAIEVTRRWSDEWLPRLGELFTQASLAGALHGMASLAGAIEPPAFDTKQEQPTWADEELADSLPIIREAAASLARSHLLALPSWLAAKASAQASASLSAAREVEAITARVRSALITSVESGGTLAEFRKELRSTLDAGILSPASAETVFRTNVMAAYSDGQERLLADPAVGNLFPFRAYHATHDSRVRPEHLALEKSGIGNSNIYLASDQVWQMIRPPVAFNCRCSSTPISIAEAARRGIEYAKEWQETGIEPGRKAWVNMPDFRPDPQFLRERPGVELSTAGESSVSDDIVGMLSGVLGGYELATASSWTRYKGTRGGHGWKNEATGEVLYQDADPNTRGRRVEAIGVDPDHETPKELPIEMPYKTKAKDRAEYLAGRFAERIRSAPDEHLKSVLRSQASLALAKSVRQRINSLSRKFIDEGGNEMKDLPEYRTLRDAGHSAQIAALDLGRAIGTPDEEPAKKKLHSKLIDMSVAVIQMGDAFHNYHDSGLFHFETKSSAGEGFPSDDSPRDRNAIFDELDKPNAVPEELQGIELKKVGDDFQRVFNGVKVSKEEEAAIAHYTGNGYRQLNIWLRWDKESREDEPLSPKHSRTYKTLRKMFARLKPSEKPVILYRGLRLTIEETISFMKQIKQAHDAGEPIKFAGFSSCTLDPGIATAYGEGGKIKASERKFSKGGAGNDVVFEISARKGLHINALSADEPGEDPQWSEREMLLDHDSEFEVAAIRSVPFVDMDGKKTERTVIQLRQRV